MANVVDLSDLSPSVLIMKTHVLVMYLFPFTSYSLCIFVVWVYFTVACGRVLLKLFLTSLMGAMPLKVCDVLHTNIHLFGTYWR